MKMQEMKFEQGMARERQSFDMQLAARKQALDAALKREHNKDTANAQVRNRAASKLQ
jgi:hypothetical protein